MYKFEFPSFVVDYEFTKGQLDALQIKPHQLVSDWVSQNLSLCGGYLNHGPIKLKAWQKQVLNSPNYYDTCLWLGPTQTGKSFLSESFAYYCMGEMKVNGFLTYAESDTAETVFSEKVKLMIVNNEVLRDQWNGDDKRLTVKRVRLNQCTWRIASAQNKNDIASHHAGVCIGSEVGKWEKSKKFNPVALLKGRQGAYHDKGFQKLVLETTPFESGDYMYSEVYREGTLILHPFYPCPHCGVYHEYTDHQIKVRDDKFKSDYMIRLHKQEAVYYECPNCNKEITEAGRAFVDERVVWAAPEINKEDFHQQAEIINPDGSIDGVFENGYRPQILRICYQWPRGVDINYQWWKWLADYFEAKNDPVKLKTYQNEVNANYFTPKTNNLNVAYIESKKGGYNHKGNPLYLPDDVLLLSFGSDTQDNGFYYMFLGWGYGLTIKILKHGFIHCDVREQQYKDPTNTYIKYQTVISMEKMLWHDNVKAWFSAGFIDRGGHRSNDVDYICSKIPNLHAYIGLTRPDPKQPLFYESQNGPYYLGQTESISKITSTIIDSPDFYIPDDFHSDLCRQLARQYFIKKISPDGTEVEKWIHGGDDHFRDCLNLGYIAGIKKGFDKILLNQQACEMIYKNRNQLVVAGKGEQIQQQGKNTTQRPRSIYDQALRGRY